MSSIDVNMLEKYNNLEKRSKSEIQKENVSVVIKNNLIETFYSNALGALQELNNKYNCDVIEHMLQHFELVYNKRGLTIEKISNFSSIEQIFICVFPNDYMTKTTFGIKIMYYIDEGKRNALCSVPDEKAVIPCINIVCSTTFNNVNENEKNITVCLKDNDFYYEEKVISNLKEFLLEHFEEKLVVYIERASNNK